MWNNIDYPSQHDVSPVYGFFKCQEKSMGERHKKVKALERSIGEVRVGREPTTSTILERRLNHSATGDLWFEPRILNFKVTDFIKNSFNHLLGKGSVFVFEANGGRALAQES